jgi:hypothetical protein
MAGSGLGAIVLLAVFWFWPATQSARLGRELQDARSELARLGQQVEQLRSENQRVETLLAQERARGDAASADLRRVNEMNARLQALLSEGRK